MKKVSIVVPVYNVEKYLDACVKSLIKQTYENIEIILVDDGSKDKSGVLCDEYATKDSRIKSVHKVNGGLSSARNYGMKYVTGDYIMFLDSDDMFLPDSCRIMLEEIEKTNADIVTANYMNCNDDGTPWDKPKFDKEKYTNFKINIHDYNKSFYIMNSCVWNKIFRTSFIKELNYEFVEGLPAEDAIFTSYCFLHTNKVYYTNDVVYLYRQRNNSTSISSHADTKYFDGISEAYKLVYMNFKNAKELNFYRYLYIKSLFYIMCNFVDSSFLTDEDKVYVFDNFKWFFLLSKQLGLRSNNNPIFEIVEQVVNDNYDKAIDLSRILAKKREDMKLDERLAMSSIPLDEYARYIDSNINL